MAAMNRRRPAWWGGKPHVVYTIVVFIILASLDNAALAMIPAMVKPVSSGIGSSEFALGFITGPQILVIAVTAVGWGYAGDARTRKPLLLWGTIIWATAELLSATSSSFVTLFAWQMIAGVGLGSIASVGFSVVSDFIGPARRGLAMSFWGLSQGIGFWFGGLLASQLGADDFRIPLVVIAVLGYLFAFLYLFTYEAPRGIAEPELSDLYERGGEYTYRIDRSQIPLLFKRRTNVWLILQGFTAQIAYGALMWYALLFQEKVAAEGYSEATSTAIGGIFSALVLLAGLTSIAAGWLGDKAQSRTLRGRAVVSAVGILGAIPFFLISFWAPLRGLEVTEGANFVTRFGEVLTNIATNPWVFLAFVSALIAITLTSADSPNWFALISDVNLPEHRGTVFGLGNLANGGGRSLGNSAAAAIAGATERSLPPPVNWAMSMSLSLVFFLPTGWCYWKASETSPGDIEEARATLRKRARAAPDRQNTEG